MSFLKKIFGGQKQSKPSNEGQFIRIALNDKLMPIDRGVIYEDPFDEMLKRHKIGEVTGGGTMQLESGEIKCCDLEVFINSDIIDSITIRQLKDEIEDLGAPKGSKIVIEKTDEKIEIGKLEGLGVYLDGKNLPPNVYEENDINVVIGNLKSLLKDDGETIRYWEGNEETALYFYGESFNEMSDNIAEFLNRNPLCENARIENIA